MYTDTSISTLETLVGWAKPIPPAVIVLDEETTKADGRLSVTAFHRLCTTENMYACVDNAKISMTDFNTFLRDMRREVVVKVLDVALVYNTNEAFIRLPNGNLIDRTVQDFDPMVTSRKALFTRAIGYQLAVDCIELMISTPRMNGRERNAALSYESLKIELEGLEETNSKGLMGSLYGARKALSTALFPNYIKKPTARFVQRG